MGAPLVLNADMEPELAIVVAEVTKQITKTTLARTQQMSAKKAKKKAAKKPKKAKKAKKAKKPKKKKKKKAKKPKKKKKKKGSLPGRQAQEGPAQEQGCGRGWQEEGGEAEGCGQGPLQGSHVQRRADRHHG